MSEHLVDDYTSTLFNPSPNKVRTEAERRLKRSSIGVDFERTPSIGI